MWSRFLSRRLSQPVASALRCASLLFFLVIPVSLHAEFIESARIGAGVGRYEGSGSAHTTNSQQGAIRFSYHEPESTLLLGLEGTAFRFGNAPKLRLTKPIDGNNINLIVGTYFAPYCIWIGAGGGQMRILARSNGSKTDPLHYATREYQLGSSFDVYRADYGKVEVGLIWRRMLPEAGLTGIYAFKTIDAWQFELGFKLLNW